MKSTQTTTWLLTGQKDAGKTTWLSSLILRLREQGAYFFGVLSPKFFRDGELLGIEVVDLATDHRAILAEAAPKGTPHRWFFSNEGIALGNAACDPSTHRGLCIVDEIGPLEIEGGGFSTAWTMMQKGSYERVLAVVRPSLIDTVRPLLPEHTKIIRFSDELSASEVITDINLPT